MRPNELQIRFSRSADSFEAVTVNNKSNRRCNTHIENVIKKRSLQAFSVKTT